jgi:hypothetical protein
MPYTPEELQDVDFYQEFIGKKSLEYLNRLAKSALNGFRKGDNILVSFEDIESGMGLEDANLNSPTYIQLATKLSGAVRNQLLNILNKEFNEYTNQNPPPSGYNAGSGGAPYNDDTNAPTEYYVTDIPTYIETLTTTAYKGVYIDTLKDTNLEQLIDRSMSELIDVEFATELPEGILNGDYVTNEFVTDTRKWKIQNNQKRVFPDLNLFYGLSISFSDIKMLTTKQLNTIPDGEPAE